MKAQSNTKPPVEAKEGPLFIYRYDTVLMSRTNDDGSTTAYYEYESVSVPSPDVNLLIEAIIRSRYTVNDEFRMNRLRDSEFDTYSDFVEDAKFVAKVLLGHIALDTMLVDELDRTAEINGLEDYPDSALKAVKLAYLQENVQ